LNSKRLILTVVFTLSGLASVRPVLAQQLFPGPSDAHAPAPVIGAVQKIVNWPNPISLCTKEVIGSTYNWYKKDTTGKLQLVQQRASSTYTEVPAGAGYYTYAISVTDTSGSTSVISDLFKVYVLPDSVLSLSALKITNLDFSPAFAAKTTRYTASVPNAISSVIITPRAPGSSTTITVDKIPVSSATESGPISLNPGTNIIEIALTPKDGLSALTYTVNVTRAPITRSDSIDRLVNFTADAATFANEGVVVHHAVSPNGDGINDFLVIDGIANHPDNHLVIMDRSGLVVYDARGYDNKSRIFDGHSNKNGAMQLRGTYFYVFDYTVSGVTKRTTGFLVLRY